MGSRDAWVRLAACAGAAALLQLDGTLITVALPSLGRGLGVSGGSTAVVLSAYFAAFALILIPAGAWLIASVRNGWRWRGWVCSASVPSPPRTSPLKDASW